MTEFNNIELRSEKARTIIGSIPPKIVQYGITIMTVILLGLFICAYYIPYPENLKISVVIISSNDTEILIPYKYIDSIHKGSRIGLNSEGNQDGSWYSIITHKSEAVVNKSSKSYFKVYVQNINRKSNFTSNMKVTANILVLNKSIWQHIME